MCRLLPDSLEHRVGKCHGYDGYIRVKRMASSDKKFGRTKNKQKQATFWKICATSVRPSGQTSMDFLVLSAKKVAIYALFSG